MTLANDEFLNGTKIIENVPIWGSQNSNSANFCSIWSSGLWEKSLKCVNLQMTDKSDDNTSSSCQVNLSFYHLWKEQYNSDALKVLSIRIAKQNV